MPRAIVTPELAETLRGIRLQNKIQAKSLAAYIGKSPAFISKLESGNIQTIDTKELYSILQFISGENSSTELAEQIYASLRFKYSSKEIEEQLWFTNYDTVECLLPIPEALIDDMVTRLGTLGVSRSYLNTRINANEALSPEDINDDSIEFFQYHRASDSWIWPAHGEVNTFLIETCKIRDGKKIALIFSLTADIAPERVMSVFDADVLFFVKARHTGVDCIQSPEDLANFWGKYQEACDIIKNVYPHTNEVSVFSAMPASAAFEVGRKYMPGVYPKLKIYDEDNGFFETITIGGID